MSNVIRWSDSDPSAALTSTVIDQILLIYTNASWIWLPCVSNAVGSKIREGSMWAPAHAHLSHQCEINVRTEKKKKKEVSCHKPICCVLNHLGLNLFSLGLLQWNNSFAFPSPWVFSCTRRKVQCRSFSEGRLSRRSLATQIEKRGHCTESSGEELDSKRGGKKLRVVWDKKGAAFTLASANPYFCALVRWWELMLKACFTIKIKWKVLTLTLVPRLVWEMTYWIYGAILQ